jgi:hypothetical protein
MVADAAARTAISAAETTTRDPKSSGIDVEWEIWQQSC